MQKPSQHPRCLGIDPGIANTGWALVEKTTQGYNLSDSGVITTVLRTSLGDRLSQHFVKLHEILEIYQPAMVSIEAVYFNKNISSCISTASVIGIVELASEQADIPTLQINPQFLKAAVTGSSFASKLLVKRNVNRLMGSDIRNGHESDACAAAIAGLLKLL